MIISVIANVFIPNPIIHISIPKFAIHVSFYSLAYPSNKIRVRESNNDKGLNFLSKHGIIVALKNQVETTLQMFQSLMGP